MKDKFGSGFSIDFKTIDYAKTFGFECSVAVYLLGLTLGYDKTYDAYYDFVKLPIFELRTENQEANKLDLVQESNEKEIYSENRNENVAVDLSSEDKPAFNDKEVSTLRSMGYKIAKRFSKEEKSYIISQGYEVS